MSTAVPDANSSPARPGTGTGEKKSDPLNKKLDEDASDSASKVATDAQMETRTTSQELHSEPTVEPVAEGNPTSGAQRSNESPARDPTPKKKVGGIAARIAAMQAEAEARDAEKMAATKQKVVVDNIVSVKSTLVWTNNEQTNNDIDTEPIVSQTTPNKRTLLSSIGSWQLCQNQIS